MELFHCFQALLGDRHLHHDVSVDFGQGAAFVEHFSGRERYSLQADRPIHECANITINLQGVSPGFCDVRRIGGYAVNNASTPSLFDVLSLRAIYEYFHSLPSVPGSTAGAQFSVSPAACPARIDPLRWAGRNGAHD